MTMFQQVCACHGAEKCPDQLLRRRIASSKKGPSFKHPAEYGDLPLKAANYLREALGALEKGHYSTSRALTQTCTDIIGRMEQGERKKSQAFSKAKRDARGN